MANESALTVSLEEFGLSRYEARAYVTLITRGTMSAGDLAFYSDIPRPKIYPTMRKLTNKNLALMSNSKSVMMCTAVKPEDAFDEIIHEQIQKVTAMNALVADLKKASEENRKSSDSEERRYIQVGTSSVPGRIRSMIEEARASITIISDMWGLGLLAECKEQLLAAQKKDIAIRCIIPYEQICSKLHRSLPGSIEIRAAHTAGNYIIFDATEVLILDNTNGCGSVFPATSTFGTVQTAMFEDMWSRSMRTDPLVDMTSSEAQEICNIIETVNVAGLSYVLNNESGHSRKASRTSTAAAAAAATSKSSNQKDHDANKKNSRHEIPELYGLLEREGIILEKRPLYDVMCMFDSIMQITCAGHARLESGDRSITVETPQSGSANALPWITILEGLLRRRGYDIKTIHQAGSKPDGNEKTHIRLGRI